jgi:hypothetical protein
MDLWRTAPDGATLERLTQHNSEVAYPTPIDPRTIVYIARDKERTGPWLWALDIERRVTRRVSLGLEKYTSVSSSADGSRRRHGRNPTASGACRSSIVLPTSATSSLLPTVNGRTALYKRPFLRVGRQRG